MPSSMRRLALTTMITAFMAVTSVHAAEVTLFDSHEHTVAYIADDLTIYVWSGEPVAYIERDANGEQQIYGFNGKHLGWYVAGVVRDHRGYVVGARRGAFASGQFAAAVQYEGFKAFKQLMPVKAVHEFPPPRSPFISQWSPTSLEQFLAEGRT